jgi:hypothetical protein
LLAGPRGLVEIGALLAALFQKALLFQDVHHRHDGGVGDFAAGAQRFVNVAHGRGGTLLDDFHDLEFLRGERGILPSHDNEKISTSYPAVSSEKF